jgi:hypothetical protein
MKFIITVFYLLFLSNIAFAESSWDHIGSDKGSLDKHFVCKMKDNESNIEEFGFHKINNRLFVYSYWADEKVYDVPYSIVKTYKSKIQGMDLDVFLFFSPLDPTMPTGSGIEFKTLTTSKSKKMKHFIYNEYWIDNTENDKAIGNNLKNDIYDEWASLVNNVDPETHDQNIENWTNKVFNLISKKLDLGDPFELVDLEVAPWEKVLLRHPSNKDHMLFISRTCKR